MRTIQRTAALSSKCPAWLVFAGALGLAIAAWTAGMRGTAAAENGSATEETATEETATGDAAAPAPVIAAADLAFFESRIRPVLARECYECHSSAAKEPKGGLLLDTRRGLLKGGDSGAVIVAGSAAESLLLQALRHESLEMPPNKRLPDDVVADFARWIEIGAPDPRDLPLDSSKAAQAAWEAQYEERRTWWSLQPLQATLPPQVQSSMWAVNPIDCFILAQLEKRGLEPAPRGDRRALLRRLSFALVGLPPTGAEAADFLADGSPDAWEKLVDRLMSSPRFGEQWARHWMDVVRYTDTYGYEWDIPAKGAWRYRDYLMRAFNADLPFDQLVREHIAGDLLETPRANLAEQTNESRIGVMFFQMGEKRHGDSAEFDGIHQEMLDNKIDAFGKAFQATTIACARCHDHKLDAIAQREYYALGGVLMSSRWVTNTVDLPERHASAFGELTELKQKLRGLLAPMWRAEIQAQTSETWNKLVLARQSQPPPLEDMLFPWYELDQAARNGGNLAECWLGLAQRYRDEQVRRAQENAANFTLVADFREGLPPNWSADGVGLSRVTGCGDFTVALEGEAMLGQILHGGLVTHALSPRMNGAVRTPYLDTLEPGNLSFDHLSFELCGGDFAARRTVVDNAFLTERQQYIDQRQTAWHLAEIPSGLTNHRVYFEIATKTSNPNFPPRVGLGGPCSEEQAADPRSWFGITRVMRPSVSNAASSSGAPGAPVDELSRFARLFEGEPPTTLDEASARYAACFDAAVWAWENQAAGDDDVRLLNWLLDAELLTNRRAMCANAELGACADQYRAVEKGLPLPSTVNGMADLDPGYDYRLNVRGEYDQLAEAVPRGYLRVLGAPDGFAAPRSGRRELAEIIASPDNPLTARVFVNRVWHWLFGRGLVSTPDDFGHLGDRPSHPELLDYLAARFIAEDWSVKKLIREIVTSETWRQSGQTSEAALAADPENRLVHHFPLRRLEAETLRDTMLAVSGRLDSRLYGPPIDPYRQNEDPQKRLFSGPVDGQGRRSLYTKITIMEAPKFLATFNQPSPKIPTGKRDVSTTPAQSLALLNDPFVTGQAEHWARGLVEQPDADPAARITHMFESALCRPPTPEETARWMAAVEFFANIHGVPPADVLKSTEVWKDAAHALYNTKEFIYVR